MTDKLRYVVYRVDGEPLPKYISPDPCLFIGFETLKEAETFVANCNFADEFLFGVPIVDYCIRRNVCLLTDDGMLTVGSTVIF